MEDELDPIEVGTQLLVQAMGHLLKDYEGIIIHLDGHGFCLWKDPVGGRIEVMEDEAYLQVESGRMTWVHDDESTAPDIQPGDEVIGSPNDKKLH